MLDYISKVIDINSNAGEVTVKQYDHLSRFLHIQIVDKDKRNEPFDLTGCKTRIYVEPAFGVVSEDRIGYISGDVEDGENGIVVFFIPNSITQEIGNYNCEVYINDPTTGGEISTFPFVLRVVKSIRRDDIIEKTNQFSALEDAINTVDGLDERITNIVIPIDHLSAALKTPSTVISDGTVHEMLRCAESYFNYAYTADGQDSGILYENHNGLYSETLGTNAANGQYGIVCSSFACAIINGVFFENSRYSGKSRNIKCAWGVEFDNTGEFGTIYDGQTQADALKLAETKYLSSQNIAKYAEEHGYLFPIDSNHKVRPGDLLFNGNVEGNHLGINHVAIAINVDREYCTVIQGWPSTKHDGANVGLGIGYHVPISDYRYAATFPFGSVSTSPQVLESYFYFAGNIQNVSGREVIKEFGKTVPKGFYTVVCHGEFSITPYICIRYSSNSDYLVQAGDMIRVGNDYYATIYVENDATICVVTSSDVSYDIREISLFKGFANITSTADKLYWSYQGANKLRDGNNLNDCKIGIWYCQDKNTANGIANNPLAENSPSGFRLESVQLTESDRFRQTVCYASEPGKIYVRTFIDNGWTGWRVFSSMQQSIECATQLYATNDLDDCKIGVWHCLNADTAKNISHTPLGNSSPSGFRLESVQLTDGDRYKQTVSYISQPDRVYSRHFAKINDVEEWQPWYVYVGAPV